MSCSSTVIQGVEDYRKAASHWIPVIKVVGLADRLQRDRLYLPPPIPFAFGRCGRVVSCNGVRAWVPAHQIFRKLVNHLPRCRVTRRYDPRACIECPYYLLSVSSNPMTPDPMILFELLVQLQESADTNARPLTVAHLTSIHSFQSIGRIPIVTLYQA